MTPHPRAGTAPRLLLGLVVVLIWFFTRALVVLLLLGRHAKAQGDLNYFADVLGDLSSQGWSNTLVEYPLPGVVVIAIPWVLVHIVGQPDWFKAAFIALLLAIDAAYLVLLRRTAGSWDNAAVAAWLFGLPLLGATVYARFDLVPGVLVGLAVLAVAARPRLAATAAALATGVKLWPALILPGLAARRWQPVVSTVVVVGGALVLLSLVLGGPARLFSPLTWQADRGLQIESVPATPAMVAWAAGADGFAVRFSEFKAFEISGPGVPFLLGASDVATGVLLVGLALLWWRAWRRGADLSVVTIGWLSVAAISGFIVTGKVFSPQYLLWVLPVAAAMAAMARRGSPGLARWLSLLCVACVLTQMVFPVLYQALIEELPGTPVAVLVLACRNALMVWLTWLAWREAWRRLGTPQGAGEREVRQAVRES